jgi:glycosyltransferase involved in cell wall biosynthesis
MRIAHVTDFYLPRLGGIEMHVADLAAHQRDQGHEVQVITSTPGESGDGVVRTGTGPHRAHLLNPRALRHGVRAATVGFDVVHVHAGIGSPFAFLTARSAARAGVPTLVTMHSVLDGYQGLFRLLDRLGGWSELPIMWTAVSECAARPLRQALGGTPVQVLPNGIHQAHWRFPRGASPSAAGGPRTITAVAVMRLTARKRPIPLLRVVRDARGILGADIDLRLIVAGDGSHRARMERYLRRHRLTDAVQLRGRLDRLGVQRLLGEADLFIAPANLESFGIAALEARCAGLPVIAKRTGGIGEFIRDGLEGELCDQDRDMSGALARLSRDFSTREAMAAHNRTELCQVDWNIVAERTERLYRAAQLQQQPRVCAGSEVGA